MPKAKRSDLKPLDRVLVNLEDAAALCDLSPTIFREMSEAGLAPRPIRLDNFRQPRWSRAAIEQWAIAGCPRVA